MAEVVAPLLDALLGELVQRPLGADLADPGNTLPQAVATHLMSSARLRSRISRKLEDAAVLEVAPDD